MGETPIDSPQNQYVKLFRSLAQARGRKQHGLFAVEGTNGVQAMLAAGQRAALGFVSTDYHGDPALPRALGESCDQLFYLTPRALAALSDTVTPQGVAAAAPLPRYSLADLQAGAEGVVMAVWELRDPGNMGTIIRTADAAGARGLVAVDRCVDFFSPKVVRATAGSIFHLPLVSCSLRDLSDWAEATGAALVATDATAEDPCWGVALPASCVLMIGSEAHGLPDKLLAEASLRVRIPMFGRAESLNAAVAAAILLYEYNRQKRQRQDNCNRI